MCLNNRRNGRGAGAGLVLGRRRNRGHSWDFNLRVLGNHWKVLNLELQVVPFFLETLLRQLLAACTPAPPRAGDASFVTYLLRCSRWVGGGVLRVPGATGRAGGFPSQCFEVQEEILVIHICWIFLQGRGHPQLSLKKGGWVGLRSQTNPGSPGLGAAWPANLGRAPPTPASEGEARPPALRKHLFL